MNCKITEQQTRQYEIKRDVTVMSHEYVSGIIAVEDVDAVKLKLCFALKLAIFKQISELE